MKFKTTQKAIRANFPVIISVGYCNLQNLLQFENPVAYTTRVEGWAADIYDCGGGVAIVTGYAPFGKVRPAYDIQRKYDQQAARLEDWREPYENRVKARREILKEFIAEAVPEC